MRTRLSLNSSKFATINEQNSPESLPIKILTLQSELENLIEKILKEYNEIFLTFKLKKDNAYLPEISAIGVILGDKKYLIDICTNGLDTDSFADKILNNRDLLKIVFDLDVVMEALNGLYTISYPVFDVQIAGMFCGYGDRNSCKSIVLSKYNNVQLPRILANPKWGLRPFNYILLNYFCSELDLFKQAYEIVKNDLILNNRVNWFNDFVTEKLQSQGKSLNPIDAWRSIRFTEPSVEVIKRAKHLCVLRDELAQRFKVNPIHVFNDDTLKEIAEEGPTLPEDLVRIRSIPPKIKKGFYVKRIIGTILAANRDNDTQMNIEEFNYDILPMTYLPIVDMLKILLRLKSAEYNISAKLITDVYDMALFISKPDANIKFMEGWRYEVFGKHAQSLKNGEVGLYAEGDGVILINMN
jgi:ribonuclease D